MVINCILDQSATEFICMDQTLELAQSVGIAYVLMSNGMGE